MAGGLPARAALGAALAAILAAARFPAPAPGRPTVPFDLDEVRVGVHQGNAAGEPLGVRVTLVRERGWLERWFGGELRCGVAGPDLRVTVDGEEPSA